MSKGILKQLEDDIHLLEKEMKRDVERKLKERHISISTPKSFETPWSGYTTTGDSIVTSDITTPFPLSARPPFYTSEYPEARIEPIYKDFYASYEFLDEELHRADVASCLEHIKEALLRNLAEQIEEYIEWDDQDIPSRRTTILTAKITLKIGEE